MNSGVIGEPGSGKTHSLLTLIPYAEKTKSKISIIDVEGKFINDIRFKAARDRGLIDVFSIGTFVEKKTMREASNSLRMVPQNSQGWYRLCEAVDTLQAKSGEYCARVCDTFTELDDHLKMILKQTGGKATMEFAEWELKIQNLKLFFGEFGSIGDGKGLNIMNMHLSHEKDSTLAVVKMLPLIQGSFADQAGGYFHELYWAYAKDNGVGKATDYMWRVRPNAKIMCRTDVFGPSETDVKQDWTPIWQKLL